MSGFILAIDQGTTSSRAIVFDGAMKVVGARPEGIHRSIIPHPAGSSTIRKRSGRASSATCREALKTAGLAAADIAAIGITNQRETVVIWDKATGKPIHNAIVWQDRRTAALCAEAEEAGAGADVHAEDRPAARSLFLRHQDRLAARQCEGARAARRARRAAGRHHRQLPDLAADRRQGACHRRDQRLAHAALQHRDERLGRRAAARSCASRPRCCRR